MSRICVKHGKRRFKSAGAARRSANARGMVPFRVYVCPDCETYHITSSKPLHHDADQPMRDLNACERRYQEEHQQRRAVREAAQIDDLESGGRR